MKAKKIIITLAFAFLMLGLKAQDKYEYATVILNGTTGKKSSIAVSSAGKYTETQVKVNEGSFQSNFTPLLEIINKMTQEGWEVYGNSVTTNAAVFVPTVFYFLRRKK